MKNFTSIAIVSLILTLGVAGCRKGPGYLTPLPSGRPNATRVQDPTPGPGFGTGGIGNTSDRVNPVDLPPPTPQDGTPQPNPESTAGWTPNAEIFKDRIVHFAFDSSAVAAAEKSKVASVADYLKANISPRTAVRIEGHCDERGTEGYNQSLGERRALAIRDELISLGIDASRVETISYGEDRPAAMGSDESAWRLNRRGEFILLTEP